MRLELEALRNEETENNNNNNKMRTALKSEPIIFVSIYWIYTSSHAQFYSG